MATETEVVFPRALSDIYPAPAQKLYIETYKQSWATAVPGAADSMSRESVASRDAWEAVGRQYVQDPVTHKFHRIGDPSAGEPAPAAKRSILGSFKGLFKR